MNAFRYEKQKQAPNSKFGPAKTPSAGLVEARKSEVYEDPSRSLGSGGLKIEEQLPKCEFAESDSEPEGREESDFQSFSLPEGREEPDFQSLSAIKMSQDVDCASMAPIVSLLNGQDD